jgi:hypothetical protein
MRRTVSRLGFAVCLCFVLAASAWAQDDRKVGLTIGYPSAAGVLWQVADRVAIRTDTFFSSSWTDTDSSRAGDEFLRFGGASTSTSGHTFGVGVSVLVTVAKWERLRAYLAPRAAYGRSSNESEISFSTSLPGIPTVIQPATFETKVTTQTYGASFGTQYGLGERFAAFGEVGVAYSSSRPSSGGALVFGSGGSTSPIFGGTGGVTSSISSLLPRPRTNTLGIRSGVGVIFFF